MLGIPAAPNAGRAVAFLILTGFFLPSIHGPFWAVAVEMLPSKSMMRRRPINASGAIS